jgi:uncharacterized protein (TIGR03086 family)
MPDPGPGTPDARSLDPVALDRAVLAAIDPILARVRPADLDQPSTCAGWSLGDLLRHMVGHHRGFAAAAGGAAPPDLAVWDGATLDEADPYATYRAAAQQVTAAFGAAGLMDRRLAVYVYGTFPARVALTMHAVDFLGHGWDVARTIGAPEELPEDLCLAGLAIAARWPDTPGTWGTGPESPFRPRLPVPADAPAYQRLMGFLGRDAIRPQWTN